MQGCFLSLLVLAMFIFVVLTLIRWFEATIFAVEQHLWLRVALLVAFPFSVWYFPSPIAAGRPMPVPRHEPVRGMGTVPKPRPGAAAVPPVGAAKTGAASAPTSEPSPPPIVAAALPEDQPPPGTPKEFLGMPVIPPRAKKKSSVDPEKLEQLRQKMREQGML